MQRYGVLTSGAINVHRTAGCPGAEIRDPIASPGTRDRGRKSYCDVCILAKGKIRDDQLWIVCQECQHFRTEAGEVHRDAEWKLLQVLKSCYSTVSHLLCHNVDVLVDGLKTHSDVELCCEHLQ
jgi:hypothetical protein